MKTKCFRHGEICFELIDSLPTGLEKSKNKEFLKGSHGHAHSFSKGEFYPKVENEYIFGYFVAKGTKLLHEEHGDKEVGGLKESKLPDGIYKLRRAVENINDELKQVID